jgi:two-component system, response regulator PdtaR
LHNPYEDVQCSGPAAISAAGSYFAPGAMGEVGLERVQSSADHGGLRASLGRRRLLIVEDDYFIALQSESALTAAGYEVIGIVANAAEAVSTAMRENPDLVLMDIRLARGSDGIEAATQLFQFGIRSIFVTAHSDPATRSKAAAAEPLGWVLKPFASPALIKAVAGALLSKDQVD